ncbi:MAG: hypothetical protein KY468_07970 [Armatimonadetes bacterium]|nr:hypothetical protein [Armatimonadota bacterium]
MEVRLALTADYANVSQEGKLNVMGIFSRILSQQYPATHPLMHLVLVFTAEANEKGQTKDVRIRLVDGDGKAMMDLNGQFPVPDSPGPTVELQQIFALQMLQFPQPGQYEFQILVDGKMRSTLPLELATPAPPLGL